MDICPEGAKKPDLSKSRYSHRVQLYTLYIVYITSQVLSVFTYIFKLRMYIIDYVFDLKSCVSLKDAAKSGNTNTVMLGGASTKRPLLRTLLPYITVLVCVLPCIIYS